MDNLYMTISTLKELPGLKDAVAAMNATGWPEFLLHWKCPAWKKLFTDFAGWQVLLMEGEKLLGFGHTMPLFWDKDLKDFPDDLRRLMDLAVLDRQRNIKPNVLLALAAVVSPEHKGKGLSFELLKAMKKMALKNGIKTVMLPTRPTLKYKYPLIPVEKYALWKRADGSAFDPWTRAHFKMGGKPVKTSEACITMEAPLADWEKWTGLAIPESGEYIVEGGLRPLKADREKGTGIYTVPCLWMKYET